jgi:hypothetical protein
MQQMAPRIVSGEPFTERKSTFQVCVCVRFAAAAAAAAAAGGAAAVVCPHTAPHTLCGGCHGSQTPAPPHHTPLQAHVAPVSSVAQVRAVVAVLLQNNKIRHATHNIMAYRISVPQRPGVLLQDCDDDGEAAAGGRLLHLLQVAGACLRVCATAPHAAGVPCRREA